MMETTEKSEKSKKLNESTKQLECAILNLKSRMTKIHKTIHAVACEVERAERKWPIWPLNLFEQLAIVGEEFGELQQAVLQNKHESGKAEHVREEAIHLAAMAVRFLKNLPDDLENYDPTDWTHCEGCGISIHWDIAKLDDEGVVLCPPCYEQLLKDSKEDAERGEI